MVCLQLNVLGIYLAVVILPTMNVIKREFDFWGFVATRRFHGISMKDEKNIDYKSMCPYQKLIVLWDCTRSYFLATSQIYQLATISMHRKYI